MVTPTEADLLAAIDAAPHEDAPRLAHADWLEAHGDPERADYIRGALDTDRDTFYRWVAGLPTIHGMSWECRRGYPEVVRFRSLTAFQKGWPLTAGHRVRHVTFCGLRGGAKLAKETALASITSLELNGIEPAVVLAILRSPHLGPLHHLAVGPSYPDDFSFLPTIAQLPVLAGLRSLHYSFYSDALPGDLIGAFLRSPHLGRLRALRFGGWLGQEAMRELWRSTSLAKLTVLEVLSGGSVGPDTQPGDLADLRDGSAMPALERFRFTYSRGATTAGQAVAGANRWTRLRVLDLEAGTKVGDAGAVALAGAAHLSRLESLALRFTGISDAGAIALSSSTHFRSLTTLDLRGNMIGRAGVAAFGRATQFARLRTLSLANNPAPAEFIADVEARFRDGGPPVEEAPMTPAPPAPPVVDAPVLGTTEETALVRAIWSDPFDELARQVYADWLEEQGALTQAAILRAAPAERKTLASQLERELLADAPCTLKPALTDEGLVRVSVAVRALRSKAFEAHGPAWLRRHHVAEVCPEGKPTDWSVLFAASWLAHARGLSFEGRRFHALADLAVVPHLASLSSLTFGSVSGYGRDMTAFFRDADLRGLCRLRFPADNLWPGLLQALGAASCMSNLRHLSAAWADGGSLSYLCDDSVFSGIVTLTIGIATNDGMKILADARGLGSLRNLDLSRSGFNDWGLDVLANSPLLARLQRFRIAIRAQTTPSLERFARAIPAHCRLVITGEIQTHQREVLSAILGERLVLE